MYIHFIHLMFIQVILIHIILMLILILYIHPYMSMPRTSLNTGVYVYYGFILAPIMKLLGGGINGFITIIQVLAFIVYMCIAYVIIEMVEKNVIKVLAISSLVVINCSLHTTINCSLFHIEFCLEELFLHI